MANVTITVTINDDDQKIMKNDVVNINDWVQDAVTGKINSCWKRMHANWSTQLLNDESFTDAIPSNKTDFLNLVLARPNYENAKTRDDKVKGN
nr:hypothetical protein [uncultured Mediterranean phage uvMED]|tara:strand:+ start:649 stop:927 length:279 start_codon:yes stop_codon:yes gene_type:complete